MQQFVHFAQAWWPSPRRRLRCVVLGCVISVALASCGGDSVPPRRKPSPRDVSTIAAALSDIVYQCQSVAAGLVSGTDSAGLHRDVDALLATYRRVRPNAPITIGALQTTPRRELTLAGENLQQSGCATVQARRVAAAAKS